MPICKPGQQAMVVRTHVSGVRYVPDDLLGKCCTIINEFVTPIGFNGTAPLWAVDHEMAMHNVIGLAVPIGSLFGQVVMTYRPGELLFIGEAMYDAVLMPITPEQAPNEFQKLVDDQIVRDARIPETTS